MMEFDGITGPEIVSEEWDDNPAELIGGGDGWIGAAIAAAAALYNSVKSRKRSARDTQNAIQAYAAPQGAYETSGVQKWLPPGLRETNLETGDNVRGEDLMAGLNQIGQLIQNPGQLSPTIGSAIAPQLAVTSEGIAQNYRGIRENQSGALARTNAPISLKNALASALDVNEERAQRDARRGAMTDSENLRRGDLSNTYNLLDTILNYMSSGRGHATSASNAALSYQNSQADRNQNSQAANMAALGQALSNFKFPTSSTPTYVSPPATSSSGSFSTAYPPGGQFDLDWKGGKA